MGAPEETKLSNANVKDVLKKYSEEATKRLQMRPEGIAQYVKLRNAQSERFRRLADDPWVDHAALNAQEPAVKDREQYKFLVLGAGFGGLLFAVRLIQAGFKPEDIRLVDNAGGFGGTWYWNRYPGLHCDIESYCYLPLLEETGYVPKSRYSPGSEILEHVHRITERWNLGDKALFRTVIKSAEWDNHESLWTVNMTEDRGPGQAQRNMSAKTQYLVVAGGLFTHPQMPKIPGMETFDGDILHTDRWNYSLSGGSFTDDNLSKLAGKRVGVLGTGATAIQCVPCLARHAKEVYVFQRTPSKVMSRGQRATDLEEWKTKIARHPGWQMERMSNFSLNCTGAAAPGTEDMVADGWTRAKCMGAIAGGGPQDRLPIPSEPTAVGAHIGALNAADLPVSQEIHDLVDRTVKYKDTAQKLKAWYPTWCKRITFNDEYLQTFNQPHVHLVDSAGVGIDMATPAGLVSGGKEYPLDLLILSTGYTSPSVAGLDVAARVHLEITGRGGRSFSSKWDDVGAATLHGMASSGFPNVFFENMAQSAVSSNYMEVLVNKSLHVAHVIAEAEKRHASLSNDGSGSKRTVIEVTPEAEEAWTMQCVAGATWFAGIRGCTPSYSTSEGALTLHAPQDKAAQFKAARRSLWAKGITDYCRVLKEWREEGSMQGLTIS